MQRIGNYTTFFGAEDVLSNWHRCRFVYRGYAFSSWRGLNLLGKTRTHVRDVLDPRSHF